VNYQVVFMVLSLGGLLSFAFSRSIVLPGRNSPRPARRWTLRIRIASYARRVRRQPAFLSFVSKRVAFAFGVSLAAPAFPIFFVRVAHLSDTWIGALNTVQTTAMLGGYYAWTRLSKSRGSRFVLLATILGLSLYPLGISFLREPLLIVALAGAAGFFQAGLDLVLFDELMKRVPLPYGATFVAVAQLFQYASSVVAPPLGSLLIDHLGAGPALVASAAVRLGALALFAAAPPAATR
jgi:Na+/melibiose symporter-like transporter